MAPRDRSPNAFMEVVQHYLGEQFREAMEPASVSLPVTIRLIDECVYRPCDAPANGLGQRSGRVPSRPPKIPMTCLSRE